MAQCAIVVTVSGQAVLAPTDEVPCTSVVLLTPAEYASWSNNPLNLSESDGLSLAVAILGVWAVALAWRFLAAALNTSDGASQPE